MLAGVLSIVEIPNGGCTAVTRAADGSGQASAAARSGTTDITMSARSIPMRSAIMPTSGTMSPPMPQANPIINDDTVAALMGAIV